MNARRVRAPGQRGTVGRRSAAADPDNPATTSAAATMRAARILPVSALLPLGLEPGLVLALHRLVALERLRRIDVAEGRVARRQPARGLDAEPLREHRRERLDLHLAEARQVGDSAP